MDNTQLKTHLKTQCKNFLHTALTTWATTGYNTTHGGYFAALDFDGNALHYDRTFRIHGRNIFSHVVGSVWGYSNTMNTAEKAFEFITQKCWLNKKNTQNNVDGGFPATTAVDGTHIDTHITTYEHTFALLGIAWLGYTTKNPEHLQWLDKIWSFVEKNLSHADGGFKMSIPDTPLRESNPHMHMFEVMLTLYELFKDEKWLTVAHRMYDLFTSKLFRAEERVLREFFTDDWKPDPKKGTIVDPGHHYEWTWLLHKYEILTNKTVPQISLLYDWATTYGTADNGLGYDNCLFDGTIYKNTHRLWVQTETLKAHLAMSKRTQNEKKRQTYLNKADMMVQVLFKYYLTSEGMWHDQLDSNLKNISPNTLSSTLYHIVIALHEYISS